MKIEDDFVMKEDKWVDELARLLKEPRQNKRHDIWLWLYLDGPRGKGPLDPGTCNGRTMRAEIARYLRNEILLPSQIPLLRDRFLLLDESLKWIDGDERQYQWLFHRVRKITEVQISQDLVRLVGKERLTAMIDLWDVDIGRKKINVEKLRDDWRRHKAGDSDFEWFENKEEGSQRCKCAWEWLQKNRLPRLSLYTSISNYQELLMFFDQAEYGPTEQKAIIEKIRKRWHKKQYDERSVAAGKKQVNAGLLSTTIDLLDELVKKHDLTRPQVLECLITMESRLGMIEKNFTRHALKEIAAETGSSTPTQPACTQVIIDESPVAHPAPQSQQALEAKPEPSSALVSDSASPLIGYPVSENQEAQPNGNASPHLAADRPPQIAQTATPSPPSIGNRVRTLGDIVREQEEKEARDLEAKARAD